MENHPYLFRFYRCITNDCGTPFDTTVETIAIHHANSAERATKAAMLKFQRHHRLSSWDGLATGYEMVTGPDPIKAQNRVNIDAEGVVS